MRRLNQHIVNVRRLHRSWAITDEGGIYLGAVNELPNGYFEALVPYEAHDSEPTFDSLDAAKEYLEAQCIARLNKALSRVRR